MLRNLKLKQVAPQNISSLFDNTDEVDVDVMNTVI